MSQTDHDDVIARIPEPAALRQQIAESMARTVLLRRLLDVSRRKCDLEQRIAAQRQPAISGR